MSRNPVNNDIHGPSMMPALLKALGMPNKPAPNTLRSRLKYPIHGLHSINTSYWTPNVAEFDKGFWINIQVRNIPVGIFRFRHPLELKWKPIKT